MKLNDVDVDKTIDFKGNKERTRREELERKDHEFIKGVAASIITFLGIMGMFVALTVIENLF